MKLTELMKQGWLIYAAEVSVIGAKFL